MHDAGPVRDPQPNLIILHSGGYARALLLIRTRRSISEIYGNIMHCRCNTLDLTHYITIGIIYIVLLQIIISIIIYYKYDYYSIIEASLRRLLIGNC